MMMMMMAIMTRIVLCCMIYFRAADGNAVCFRSSLKELHCSPWFGTIQDHAVLGL